MTSFRTQFSFLKKKNIFVPISPKVTIQPKVLNIAELKKKISRYILSIPLYNFLGVFSENQVQIDQSLSSDYIFKDEVFSVKFSHCIFFNISFSILVIFLKFILNHFKKFLILRFFCRIFEIKKISKN